MGEAGDIKFQCSENAQGFQEKSRIPAVLVRQNLQSAEIGQGVTNHEDARAR